jgi:hypothetical protein
LIRQVTNRNSRQMSGRLSPTNTALIRPIRLEKRPRERWQGEGPGTHGNRVQDVKPQGKEAYDYSAFTPVAETHDYSAFEPASNQPQSPTEQPSKPTENPWDIGKAWQNLFSAGSESSATLDARAALDNLNRAKAGVGRGGLFEPIRKAQDDEILADPNRPQEEKDDIISRRNDQLQTERAAAQQQYETQTKEAAQTEAAAPGPEYQRSIPGIVTKFLGRNAPYLMGGLGGPMAPALMGNSNVGSDLWRKL